MVHTKVARQRPQACAGPPVASHLHLEGKSQRAATRPHVISYHSLFTHQMNVYSMSAVAGSALP